MSMSFGFMVVIGVVVWIVEIIAKCAGAGYKSYGSSDIATNDWHQQEIFRQQVDEHNRISNEFMQQQQMENDRLMQEQFMDFSEKSVTPFEMGGFNMDFGNSFNDFGGFGGFGGGMF